MTIEDTLKQYLGYQLATDRIYFSRAPQNVGADAYVVFYRIAAEPDEHTHSGGPSPVITRTYQFSAFHESQSVAAALADHLRRKLDGFRSVMTLPQVNGCYWAGETYAFTPDTTPPIHQFNNDFRVHFREV